MIVSRETLPLVLTLILAVVVSIGLFHDEDAASAARFREDRGLNRGRIVDRNGRPLAETVVVNRQVRRLYTDPSLTSAVGYRDSDGHWHGLELRYADFLDGQQARRDWRTFFLHLRGQSVHGGQLRLTLDSGLQRAASTALGSSQGAVVALDPRTGEVLALVSKPDCSPQSLASSGGSTRCLNDPLHPLMDRATQLLTPPGSTFKIVTLSAAMDTGRFSVNSVFSGANVFGPSPYFNNLDYPSNVTRSDLTQLTLLQALAFSDNFTFAHIGLTLGARTLLTYAHRYRVGRSIPFEYPVAPSSIADGESHPGSSILAQSSFGAEVDRVTPLQMALIAATVANGGTMMAPHIVRDLEDAHGHVLARYRVYALSHVMTQSAASNVTTGMVFVVDHGSGFNAQIKGIVVAGKTGTAASGANRPNAWFIAFAPARHPVVAVAVLHQYSGEGFEYAAPIARKVLIEALREHGYRVR